MKYLILSLALITGLNTFAQKRASRDISPEEQATLSTKKLILALDLNENQQAKVYELQLANAKQRVAKREELKNLKSKGELKRPSSKERYAMQSEMLDQQIAQKEKMKNILNKDQFQKWESMQQQRMERFKQGKERPGKMGKGRKGSAKDTENDETPNEQ